jgi:hypothetical protein
MIDLQPVPVPDLDEQRVAMQRAAILHAISERRRRPMKWVVVAGAAGVAAAVSALVMGGGSTRPPAFAGWSAVPSALDASQVSTADTTCQAQLAGSAPRNLGFDPSSLAPELTDVRGPFTVTVFTDSAQDEALCMTTPDSSNTAWQWIARPEVPVGPSAVAVDRISSGSQDRQSYTLVVGRTGSGVTGVTLVLSNESDVTATTGNGLFIAWWPGDQGIASAEVTAPNGVLTQTLVTQPSTGSQTVCLVHTCGGQ